MGVGGFWELWAAPARRIDFLGDEETGEIWLNEVNPCPGSFGYFLWEAVDPPILFTELLSKLIEEAVEEFQLTPARRPDPEGRAALSTAL